ncbi:hypothetical protein FRB97_000175, partial [Tulasnella sp. 331]
NNEELQKGTKEDRDESFFKLAEAIFHKHKDHGDTYKRAQNDTSTKKDFIDSVKKRWHKLVDMTKSADDEVGHHAKDMKHEEDYELIENLDTKDKLAKTKEKHPWYFKMRGLLPRSHSHTNLKDVQPTTTKGDGDLMTMSHATVQEPEDEPYHSRYQTKPPLPNFEQDERTSAVGEPLMTPTGVNVPMMTLTRPTPSTGSFEDDPHNADGSGRTLDRSKKSTRDLRSAAINSFGDEHGAGTTAEKSLPATPTAAAGFNPTSVNIATPAPTQVYHSSRLASGDADPSRGRTSRPTSPAFGRSSSPALGRPASKAGSARSTRSAIPVAHALPVRPVQGLSGLVGDDSENPPFPRASSPAFNRPPSQARSVRSARPRVESMASIPSVDAEALRHATSTRSRQPSVSGDRPKSVKEWVEEVASTTQVDPRLMTTTEIETLGPVHAHGEQLPSYSVEGGVQPAVPSGSGHQGVGYTGNASSTWPGENKNRDEKHQYTSPWAADVNKTPHLGFGYNLPPTEPIFAPTPVMDSKAAGKRPLGRPGGGKLAGEDAPIFGSAPRPRSVSPRPRTPRPTTPEPIAPVLNVNIPQQRPIEVTVQPTVKETSRDLGNISPVSRHSRTPSKPGLFSAMAGMAAAGAAVAAPIVSESMAEGTKPMDAPRARNVSGGSDETVRRKDVEEESPIVYHPKDAFRVTARSSDPSPRSQIPPPIPIPASQAYVPPALRRPVPPVSPTMPSRLRPTEPPVITPNRLSFPESDVHPRVVPSPSVPTQYGIAMPSSNAISNTFSPPSQLTPARLQNMPRPSSSSRRQDASQTQVNVINSSRQPPSQSQRVEPVTTARTEDLSKSDRHRRRTSAEQQLQANNNAPMGAMPQQRAPYQPFVSVTGPTGQVAHARPLGNTPVTFEFGNQQDGGGVRGGTDVRRTSGGRNPSLSVTVSPVLHPVGAVPISRSRSDSIESEETVRQTRPPSNRYEQDRRDRERQLARERERERENDRYGLVRRRRDDDRSVATTRVRYASPARSDDVYCNCSSCRNAWIWKGVEYCGIAVALGLYLTFMTKVLFQNQGVRIF